MLVKTFSGSLAAKVAMGVGLHGQRGRGRRDGVLPDAAQHAVASVVSATTPFAIPDPSRVTPGSGTGSGIEPGGSTTTSSSTSTTVAGGNGSVTSTTVARSADDEAPGTAATGEDRADNHGACVSAIAKDTSTSGADNHGKVVSTVAGRDCGKTSTSTTVPGSTSSSSTSTSTTVANGSRTSNSGRGSANSGKGNSGNGNSGKNGNSGNSAEQRERERQQGVAVSRRAAGGYIPWCHPRSPPRSTRPSTRGRSASSGHGPGFSPPGWSAGSTSASGCLPC